MRLRLACFLASLMLVAAACGDDSGDDDVTGQDGGGGGPDAAFIRPDAPTPGDCNPVEGEPALALQPVADAFSSPVGLTSPPNDARLFVVEQGGTIRIIQDGQRVETPFLDISDLTDSGGERGLLGLAFHPHYGENHRFFVYYTDNDGNIQIDEYHASGDPDVADENSRIPIIEVDHPVNSNHNGGSLAFGPDGYLYAGLGDGGSGGDPLDHGQSIDILLGKLIRLDIDGASPYQAPPDNPYVGVDGMDEIYLIGVRNPWRFSFDRETGDHYIGDVGQGCWEEVDVLPAGTGAGANLGWDEYEGDSEYECPCNPDGKTFPVFSYPHGDNPGDCSDQRSITGGYVYRGCKMPGHHGRYFFSDYYGGTRSLRWTGGDATARDEAGLFLSGVSSFGQDWQGELYMCGHQDGTIYEIVPAG